MAVAYDSPLQHSVRKVSAVDFADKTGLACAAEKSPGWDVSPG